MLKQLWWVRTGGKVHGWVGSPENGNTAARPSVCDQLQGKGLESLLGLMDCLLMDVYWWTIICVCYAGYFFLCFSSTLGIPVPVAAASVPDTFPELCPSDSPLAREIPAGLRGSGGESKGERSFSSSSGINSIADAQKVFHVAQGSGARCRSMFPSCGCGERPSEGVCRDEPASSILLLLPDGSGSVILVFFSSSPLPPPPHV